MENMKIKAEFNRNIDEGTLITADIKGQHYVYNEGFLIPVFDGEMINPLHFKAFTEWVETGYTLPKVKVSKEKLFIKNESN